MRKGKYGVSYEFYAVAIMILAMFGQTWIAAGLTVLLIVVEQDEWAARQGISAVAMCFIGSIINECIYLLERPVVWIGKFVDASAYYRFQSIYNGVLDMIGDFIDIAFLVLFIIAACKVAKGGECGLPVASKFANWAYGKVAPKVAPQPVQQPVAPAQPVQQAAAQKPVMPSQPINTNTANKFCPKCGAAVQGNFCEKCGTKV